jgi:hypothetical protein
MHPTTLSEQTIGSCLARIRDRVDLGHRPARSLDRRALLLI